MRSPGHLALLTLVALAAGALGPGASTGSAVATGGDAGPGRTLAHDAYVWQRAWTGAVRASVAAAPAELAGLRVLALEVGRGGEQAWPAVDPAALVRAGRPVTAVVRVDGARLPDGLALAPVLARVAAWQAAGVTVAGIELDHDCATAALAGYAAWLVAARPPAPLRWSITALPAWADGADLPAVAAAVDELVLQVHAVRAPRIFDRAAAQTWIARFARAVPGAPLRIALPTYEVEVGGAVRVAEPAAIAGLVRWLAGRAAPPVVGVVWFRLPVDGDRRAWPVATLTAVIRGDRLAPAIAAELDGGDLVLVNRGTVAGPWPALRLRGAITGADLLGGYTASPADPRMFLAPRRQLAAGARTVVGWATGKAIEIDAR